mmetsp:Transcript_21436/g.81689  ORF Transcript_21436/g.81689 Transcript_21436/m.81689 type:complete len:218 (+) Transcript_21436:469-1122(+)
MPPRPAVGAAPRSARTLRRRRPGGRRHHRASSQSRIARGRPALRRRARVPRARSPWAWSPRGALVTRALCGGAILHHGAAGGTGRLQAHVPAGHLSAELPVLGTKAGRLLPERQALGVVRPAEQLQLLIGCAQIGLSARTLPIPAAGPPNELRVHPHRRGHGLEPLVSGHVDVLEGRRIRQFRRKAPQVIPGEVEHREPRQLHDARRQGRDGVVWRY